MRRRFASVAALQTADTLAIDAEESGSSLLRDMKLFGLTYAAGFLFVSLMIA